MIYICPGCGYATSDLSTCEHRNNSGGGINHICPKCDKPKYHFQASKEILTAKSQLNSEWLGDGETWDCKTCRKNNDRPDCNFKKLNIPAHWEDDTRGYCGGHHRGIEIKLNGLKYSAILRSVRINENEKCIFVGRVLKINNFHIVDSFQDFKGDDWDSLVNKLENRIHFLNETFSQEVSDFIKGKRAEMEEKGYKPGWLWHQVKNKYGIDVADHYLQKKEGDQDV